MKLHYILALFTLFYGSQVSAEIYKRVDADGHVTYSSTPLKGGKKLHLSPLPTVPSHAISNDKNNVVADFPRVDSATQKGRDNTRRQILEDELATEQKALGEARTNVQAGAENPEVYTDNEGKTFRNIAKQDAKMAALQEQVQMHEKNIIALKIELSNISK